MFLSNGKNMQVHHMKTMASKAKTKAISISSAEHQMTKLAIRFLRCCMRRIETSSSFRILVSFPWSLFGISTLSYALRVASAENRCALLGSEIERALWARSHKKRWDFSAEIPAVANN